MSTSWKTNYDEDEDQSEEDRFYELELRICEETRLMRDGIISLAERAREELGDLSRRVRELEAEVRTIRNRSS